MSEPRPGFTAVGRVLRAHGLHGEVRVQPFSAAAANLQAGRAVWLREVRHLITASRPDRGAFLLRITGVASRSEAELLHGELLEAADDTVLRDDPDSYFIHELVGLRVRTEAGEPLGELVEVIQAGAADVYVVRGTGKEVLFPAIGEIVKAIDLAAGEMIITPEPGMLHEAQ